MGTTQLTSFKTSLENIILLSYKNQNYSNNRIRRSKHIETISIIMMNTIYYSKEELAENFKTKLTFSNEDINLLILRIMILKNIVDCILRVYILD